MPRGHSLRTHELDCIECGQTFTTGRSDRRYCSEACAARVRYRKNLGRKREEARTAKACQECGEEFTPRRSDGRFCSSECTKRSYNRENRERLLELNKQWMAAHPEKAAEYQRRYQEKNGERERERKRQRYQEVKADPEQHAALQEKQRQYYQANRETIIERSSSRRVLDPYGKYRYVHGTEWLPLLESFWAAQDGRCYLCGDPLRLDKYRDVNLDHDHSCCPLGRSCEICRRGLACSHCNRLIGHANDDPARLRRIADNLEAANAAVQRRQGGSLF